MVLYKHNSEQLYIFVRNAIKEKRDPVETGFFADHMDIESINDGPVTLILDSQFDYYIVE